MNEHNLLRRTWPLERILFALAGTIVVLGACPASLVLARVTADRRAVPLGEA
jgi:hypothetical protein